VSYLVGARPQPPTLSVGRGRRGLLRRVPAWWSDVVLVGVAFWLYGVAQVHAPLHRLAAMDHGRWLLQAEGGLRIVYRGFDLRSVAHDSRISEQARHVVGAERGHSRRIETAERGPEVLPLAQDGEPGQARLKGLEAKPLEHAGVVTDWPAPLLVVIVKVVGSAQGPRAAGLPVRSGRRAS